MGSTIFACIVRRNMARVSEKDHTTLHPLEGERTLGNKCRSVHVKDAIPCILTSRRLSVGEGVEDELCPLGCKSQISQKHMLKLDNTWRKHKMHYGDRQYRTKESKRGSKNLRRVSTCSTPALF